LAQSLQNVSRLCETGEEEREPELKESRKLLTSSLASQPNKAHMDLSGSKAPSSPGPALMGDRLPALLRRLHSKALRSSLLMEFRSELKDGSKLFDKNKDALKYALFRLRPENWNTPRARVSPEIQPL
jgi:hypothetical protein